MDKWNTPDWLMKIFEGWFDPCPDNPVSDGLKIDWKDKTYVNPPYSNPLPWVEKAIEESKKGKTIVMLLKVDTSTRWFAKLNEAKAKIFWLNGRIKFKNQETKLQQSQWKPAGFPSMLVVLAQKMTKVPNYCGKYLGYRHLSGAKAWCGDDVVTHIVYCDKCKKKNKLLEVTNEGNSD